MIIIKSEGRASIERFFNGNFVQLGRFFLQKHISVKSLCLKMFDESEDSDGPTESWRSDDQADESSGSDLEIKCWLFSSVNKKKPKERTNK